MHHLHIYIRNWQDWGLRNARKTAFHAAVQYYSRQLGIVGYEAPLPIVWADPKTMRYHPQVTSPDETLSPSVDTAAAAAPSTATGTATLGMNLSPPQDSERAAMEAEIAVAAKNMKPTLGFLPPLADRSSHLTRVRKSRNKKANLGAGNA